MTTDLPLIPAIGPLHVGFTGTQKGTTPAQHRMLTVTVNLLTRLSRDADDKISWVAHHGSCVGADEEFHSLAVSFGAYIIIHPPSDPSKRAVCEPYDEMRPAKPYLDRDTDIVAAPVTTLIACPGQMREVRRSGTWTTVRRGRRRGVFIVYCWPDGSRTTER